MKRQKKRYAKGFTLIEVLVTIALIAIIVPILYNFLSFGNSVFFKGTAKAESQNDVNLIAYKISNQLRTVSDISLTAKTGYTEYNVKTDYPDLDSIVYTLSKVNDSYLLNFNITEDDHQVISEIELNNVKLATTGTSNDKIWVLYSDNITLKPTIVIGNASKLFRTGDPSTSINFPVKTTNIPNNALLTAAFVSSHVGLDIPSSPIVITNNAVLQINVNASVGVGSYDFKLSYPGADDVIGTIQILDHVNIYTVTFDKNGGDTQANPTSIQVQEGVSIGTLMPSNPSRTGYSFVGWNEHALGTGTVVNDNSNFTSNKTVYAQWEPLGVNPRIDSINIVKIEKIELTKNGFNVVEVTNVNIINLNSNPHLIDKKSSFKLRILVKGIHLGNLNINLPKNETYSVSTNSDKTEMEVIIDFNTPNSNNTVFELKGDITTANNVSTPFVFKFKTVNN